MQHLFDDNDPDTDKDPAKEDKPKEPEVLHIYDPHADEPVEREEPFVLSEAEPESMGETIRRSGLAYSASIALFASVVFMLILGWGADLLLGTSPWGVVVGIVVGALIGFVQFFRITSQIFKK